MHEYDLRVRFSECDMYGHINHAAYLQYLESARVTLLRDIGLPLEYLRAKSVFLVIHKITATYHEPGLLEDDLVVTTTANRLRRASGTFLQTVLLVGRDATPIPERRELMHARIDWVAIDSRGYPTPLPDELSSLTR